MTIAWMMTNDYDMADQCNLAGYYSNWLIPLTPRLMTMTWMMGRRTPKVAWKKVMIPDAKKMVEMM
jgi:hypothetical protein